MSTDIEDQPEQTAASLVSGILSDLHQLVEQQFQLTRREIEDELRQRVAAAKILGLGIGISFLGAIVLCLTLAHLLHWSVSPPGTDPARLPLWACHALVTAGLVVIGGILAQAGQARFKSVQPCRNPATKILQRNSS